MENKDVKVRIPYDKKDYIKTHASIRGMSMGKFILLAVEEYVKNNPKSID